MTKPVQIAHKLSKTQEYYIWYSMINRCNNPKNKAYHNYGGRGIKVCDRWLIFPNFYQDMGNKPSPEYEIDRIDNNDDYKPSNCHWTTHKLNANNVRYNINLTYKNKTQTLTQWAEELNMPYFTLRARIKIFNWPIKQAFELPVGHHRGNRHNKFFFVK